MSENFQHILNTPVKALAHYGHIHRYFKRWSINPLSSQELYNSKIKAMNDGTFVKGRRILLSPDSSKRNGAISSGTAVLVNPEELKIPVNPVVMPSIAVYAHT